MAANSTSPSLSMALVQSVEEMTRNADTVQEHLLAEILAENRETEYLKGFGAAADMDNETFRSKVPMVSYEDIQPLIRRMADDCDRSPILCAQPISEFLWSSGTSGEPKLIPSTQQVLDRNINVFRLSNHLINMHLKGLDKGKCLSFAFIKPDNISQGGTPIRIASSSIFKSLAFKNCPSNNTTSPKEAIACGDIFQSMYTQMLCGLCHRHQVNQIDTIFASTLVRIFKFLRLNWQQLTQDIRSGSLNPNVTDPSIRECMTRILRPDPNTADAIGKEFAKDEWEGIITRIWPNTKILRTIATGTMAQYIPTLDYYSGGLPIVCMLYASSECFFGINLDPMCKPPGVSYTILPNMAYFEFLPHIPNNSPDPDRSKLVRLVDVEIGKEYEIVVTTTAGLYRYRVGDILSVTGFHNSSPQFQFVRRKKVVLNIEWEMTTETELQSAVENASELLLLHFNTNVMDYTSFVDTTSDPDHYVICLELLQGNDTLGPTSDEVLEKCCLVMEESFNWAYRRLRVSDGLIGPLEIRVVRNGTFEEIMDCAISRGASMSQYKTPRSLRSKTMLDLLESRIVSRHFSPSLPHSSASKNNQE